jgi:hypothetical protein
MSYIPFRVSPAADTLASYVIYTATINTGLVGNTVVCQPTTLNSTMYVFGYFNVTDVWLHADTFTANNSFTLSLGITSPNYAEIVAATNSGPWAIDQFFKYPLIATTSLNGKGVGSNTNIVARVSVATASASSCTLIVGGFFTNARYR